MTSMPSSSSASLPLLPQRESSRPKLSCKPVMIAWGSNKGRRAEGGNFASKKATGCVAGYNVLKLQNQRVVFAVSTCCVCRIDVLRKKSQNLRIDRLLKTFALLA